MRGTALALLLGAAALSAQGPADFVYEIRLYDQQRPAAKGPMGKGGGFFLSEAGEFVTARHLFEESPHATGVTVEVREGGSLTSCRVDAVLASPKGADLVIVRVLLGLEKVRVPRVAAPVRKGERVTGFRPAITHGWIASEGEVAAVRGKEIEIRSDARFWTKGSSGSPVFNVSGEVLAMAIEMANGKPLFYALPLASVLRAPRFREPLPLQEFLGRLRR